MNKITFVIPSRNNLELLKLAYKSIRFLKKKHEILILNDASEDGTQEWLDSLKDKDLIVHTNPGPERVGIVGMFDKGIEMANTDIIFAFHADMIAGKNLDKNILKHLKKGKVISATRVEPPLHPEGPEKIIKNFGIEPEEFSFSSWYSVDNTVLEDKNNRTTKGVFAPWCMYKDDFLAVGGHDELFAPQSREDSDLFNRFYLKGYELIQSWDALVYHFTSRGSRYNKYAGGDTGKDSPEWKETNSKNERNFIRKWGSNVQHDKYMLPIVSPKYDIGFVVKNCTNELLYLLEPWCSTMYVDIDFDGYINHEQINTSLNLSKRLYSIHAEKKNDIIIGFDALKLNATNSQFIGKLPLVIKDSGQVGHMRYEIFDVEIKRIKDNKEKLIDAV